MDVSKSKSKSKSKSGGRLMSNKFLLPPYNISLIGRAAGALLVVTLLLVCDHIPSCHGDASIPAFKVLTPACNTSTAVDSEYCNQLGDDAELVGGVGGKIIGESLSPSQPPPNYLTYRVTRSGDTPMTGRPPASNVKSYCKAHANYNCDGGYDTLK